MDKASFIMLMATYMTVAGSKTRPTDTEFTLTQMEQSTKESGKKTLKMDLEKRLGLMAQSLKAITEMARSTARDITSGATSLHSMETGRTTIFMASEFTSGQMVDNSKAVGKTTTCTERVYTPGKMVGCTREIMKMTESTATASTPGMTESNMKGGG